MATEQEAQTFLDQFRVCVGFGAKVIFRQTPDQDEDGKEIWVFGCVEEGTEVYVKLRLDPDKPFSRPVVRSFHPPEHPLVYPLKGGRT